MNRSKKRADAPKRSGVVPSSIRLPKEMHEWVSKQPGGFTDTIKRAVELLLLTESADEPTRKLVTAVFGIAQDVEVETGKKWHSDSRAFNIFGHALQTASSVGEPKGYLEYQKKAYGSWDDPFAVPEELTLGIEIGNEVLAEPNVVARQRFRAARKKSLQETANSELSKIRLRREKLRMSTSSKTEGTDE